MAFAIPNTNRNPERAKSNKTFVEADVDNVFSDVDAYVGPRMRSTDRQNKRTIPISFVEKRNNQFRNIYV